MFYKKTLKPSQLKSDERDINQKQLDADKNSFKMKT